MLDFLQVFSNRELSLIIWIAVILFALVSIKSIRISFKSVLDAFFAKKIISSIAILLAYSIFLIYILNWSNLWSNTYIKDFIFWFLTVAMVLFFKLNNVKNNDFFKTLIFESFKLTMILEFVVNFYNFSLITELILIPIVTMIGTMQSYAEVFSYKNPDYVGTGKFLKNLLVIIGIGLICYSFYMTFIEYSQLLTLDNFKSLLLPPVFTLWILPLLYLFTLAMNYESLFLTVKYMTKDINIQRELRKQIVLNANVDLNKLMRIRENINSLEITSDISDYIKELSRKNN